MKIIDESIIRKTIAQEFTIELDNGEEIVVEKFLNDDINGLFESDWDVIGGIEEYNKLTDEEKDKVDDFIIDECVL